MESSNVLPLTLPSSVQLGDVGDLLPLKSIRTAKKGRPSSQEQRKRSRWEQPAPEPELAQRLLQAGATLDAAGGNGKTVATHFPKFVINK